MTADPIMLQRAREFAQRGDCVRCGVPLGVGRGQVQAAKGKPDTCLDCANGDAACFPDEMGEDEAFAQIIEENTRVSA